MHRSIVLAAAAGCAFVLSGCGTQMETQPAAGLVITDVTVVSPERNTPLQHAYVRIVDGKITAVSVQPLKGKEEIDGRGRYLIPGLIDSHVHLAVSPGFPAPMTAAQAAAHPELVAAALAQDPKSYLFFGFTTVLDLVGSGDRIAKWNALALRPDAYFCGAAVTLAGATRYVRYPYFSYGKTLEERLAPEADPAQNTPAAVVARIEADAAICVKMIYERGFESTLEDGRALVTAAHARNMPVFIHANRKRAQVFGVAIGADAIAHGMWRDPDEPVELDDEAREVLAEVARKRIGYQPTTQVIVGLYDMLRTDYLAQPVLADVYPAALIDLYAGNEGAAGVPLWTRLRGDAERVRLRGTIDRADAVTRILATADAHLLFGSDTPSDFIYTNPPGLNGRLEMDNWIRAGASERKLFHALTIDNARMLRLDDEIGTVEAGKIANLLLLRANPLESVQAYDTIETVLLHGRLIPRAELSARHAASADASAALR